MTESREQWLKALLHMGKPGEKGARLNQLLSLISGGEIQYVEWLYPELKEEQLNGEKLQNLLNEKLQQEGLAAVWPASLPQFQGAGILQDNKNEAGLYLVLTYADAADFYQEELKEMLLWLQQMQQNNSFPVRLLLLAFCQDTYEPEKHPQLLGEWQWEEILETGLDMIIGEGKRLAEVSILTMVAYDNWLVQLSSLSQ